MPSLWVEGPAYRDNENLMRQAFTRRAFGTVYGVGNSEELEFLGDSVLNMIVTREMVRQFSDVVTIAPKAPFQSRYSEGEMTGISIRNQAYGKVGDKVQRNE